MKYQTFHGKERHLEAHISGVTADEILNSMYNPGTLALNPQVMNFAVGCFSIVSTPHSQSVLFSNEHFY